MKNCLSFIFTKKKSITNKNDIINKENDICNLNASSSKLEILNKAISPSSKFIENDKFQFNNENICNKTSKTTIQKKISKNLTNSQDKSLSNNITRTRSIHARISKININKTIPPPKYKKKNCCICIKIKFDCFFCGGKNCKVENYLKNPNQPNAIEGLNSNFITENIIAGQRLNDILITKYNLIEKFKQLKIGLIVNLQREWEHPFCGPSKLNDFGYSYNPSIFSGDDIYVKFFGWKVNSNSLSINFILEIIKLMCTTIIENKQIVYVHSHSGNGRTAIVIACYLLYTSNKSVDDVIKEIVSKRKKSFDKKDNIKHVQVFKNFIDDSRIIYGKKEKIDVYLKRQDDLLFGDEAKLYGYIPKIITRILEEIIRIKIKYKIDNLSIVKLLKGVNLEWNNELENILFLLKQYLNKNDWSLFNANENIILFVELLFDFFEDSTFFIINPEKTDQICIEENFKKFDGKNNYFLSQREKINLFSLIKDIYYGYEFAIIYQFAIFSGNLYEKTTNTTFKIEFDEMIERFSMELQGYTLIEINNIKDKNEYNKIEIRVKALSKVINFLMLDLLEHKNNSHNNKNDSLSYLPCKSISNFLSTCIKNKKDSNLLGFNFDSKSPSIINGKTSSIFFTRDESDFRLSDNEYFSPDEEIFVHKENKTDNNRNHKMVKFATKKTLNQLLNKKIISKEQSTLLSYKKLNPNHLITENILGNVNKSQYQSKKRFSVFSKYVKEIIKE